MMPSGGTRPAASGRPVSAIAPLVTHASAADDALAMAEDCTQLPQSLGCRRATAFLRRVGGSVGTPPRRARRRSGDRRGRRHARLRRPGRAGGPFGRSAGRGHRGRRNRGSRGGRRHGRGRGPTPPRSVASSERSSAIRKPPCRSRCCCVVGVDRSVVDGLIAESTTYSMLQAGPDHRRWLDNRPDHSPPRADADEVVLLRRDGDHLFITLNRPDTRNAFNAPMRDALLEAFALLAADVSLTATLDANGPSFCSGGDLREFGTIADPATAHLVRVRRNVGRTLAEVADRVTVRVHGHCVGAGVELPAFATQVIARGGRHVLPARDLHGADPGRGRHGEHSEPHRAATDHAVGVVRRSPLMPPRRSGGDWSTRSLIDSRLPVGAQTCCSS